MANFSGWSYFFALNNLRNSNPDSVWTIARFIFPGLEVSRINLLSLTLFLTSYAILIWKLRKDSLLKICFLITLLFLIFNKVFSPQYILWLLPFLVLLPGPNFSSWKKWQFYGLEFSNLIILFLALQWFLAGHNIIYFYWLIPFVLSRHLFLIGIFIDSLKIKNPSA